jgi:hypothetical protein
MRNSDPQHGFSFAVVVHPSIPCWDDSGVKRYRPNHCVDVSMTKVVSDSKEKSPPMLDALQGSVDRLGNPLAFWWR